MKNSINKIELKLLELNNAQKLAYGYNATYEAEIRIRRCKVNVVIDFWLMTVQVISVSSNEPNMFENVQNWIGEKISLWDLLLKLK